MIFLQESQDFEACGKEERNAGHDETGFILTPIRTSRPHLFRSTIQRAMNKMKADNKADLQSFAYEMKSAGSQKGHEIKKNHIYLM